MEKEIILTLLKKNGVRVKDINIGVCLNRSKGADVYVYLSEPQTRIFLRKVASNLTGLKFAYLNFYYEGDPVYKAHYIQSGGQTTIEEAW